MVDILVVGATGYTGRLIARYLGTHRARSSFKFALAGRSKENLQKLVSSPFLSDVPTFTVDVTDDASVQTLLRESQARVVLTTAGPYLKYGKPLARACAQNGVHYADLTGETLFVKEIIEELEPIATKSGAILVPSVGFDSVPSDAVAYLSARTLRAALKSHGAEAQKSVGVAESHTLMNVKLAGASGGSLASAVNLMETKSPKEVAAAQSPDALSPLKLKDPHRPQLATEFPFTQPKRYGAFHVLVPHNIAIVQRTAALYQLNTNKFSEDDDSLPSYADNYKYYESWQTSSWITAYLTSLSLVIGRTLIALIPPLFWIFKMLIPSPGEGPSEEQLRSGWLEATNISISTPLPSTGKAIITQTVFRCDEDPGYALTAVMASEVALALLEPREKLPPLARQGGVLTPMSAVGPGLVDRLTATGKFKIESKVVDDGSK